MNYRYCFVATVALLATSSGRAATPEVAADEHLLKDHGLAVDGVSLLKFLKARTTPDAEFRYINPEFLRALGDSNERSYQPPHLPASRRQRVEHLTAALGDPRFWTREQAATELLEVGPACLEILRAAAERGDLETRRRVQACMDAIETYPGPGLAPAALRLVRQRRPVGAAAAVIAYAPFVENESGEEEVLQTLAEVGLHDGKPDPAVTAALQGKIAEHRAAAAFAVGQSRLAETRAAAHKLLADATPLVRLRAAQGLLLGKDAAAVPVLIALLNAPMEVALEAEQTLVRLAGEAGPRVVLRDDSTERRRCRDSWEVWWRNNKERIDAARLADAVFFNLNPRVRAIVEKLFAANQEGDNETLAKLLDLPFCNCQAKQMIRTRERLDKYVEGGPIPLCDEGILKVEQIVPLAEHISRLPQAQRALLNKLPRGEVRCARVVLGTDEENVHIGVFVRVGKTQTRVVGILVDDGPR